MQINIDDRDVFTSAVSFVVGMVIFGVFDLLATPTVEEVAQMKAEQEIKLEKDKMEMEMMLKAASAFGQCK